MFALVPISGYLFQQSLGHVLFVREATGSSTSWMVQVFVLDLVLFSLFRYLFVLGR